MIGGTGGYFLGFSSVRLSRRESKSRDSVVTDADADVTHRIDVLIALMHSFSNCTVKYYKSQLIYS